jgi:predicted anti-sigma-YlaC factor YlaD
MRLVGQLSSACEHARENVSLQMDGELSEFEQIALGAHLKSCARCRAYAASVGSVSAELRAAALEQPEFPVVLPHRSRLRVPARAAVQIAAAAAVAVVVGLTSAGLSLTNGGHQSVSLRAARAFPDRGPNLEPVRTSRTTIEFRSQRRTASRPMSGRVAV